MSVWFCLASGPSMTREDAEAVRGRGTVLAINTTILHAPWADVLYSCDSSWWKHYSDPAKAPAVAKVLAEFQGKRISSDPHATKFGARFIPRESGEGLGRRGLRTGNNSGYQAINLAWLQGARTIVLLGYDMQHTGGRVHWHGDHPRPLGNFGADMVTLCRPKFAALARDLRDEGVNVWNCTRDTALTCFPRMPLQQALASL